MSLDAYSYCPGGRGKKIRFCCPDMVKELQQIEDLMEDHQPSACISFIEQLERKKPGCACLSVAKLTMLRQDERWTESLEVAKSFYLREPENPLAASELAISYALLNQTEEALLTVIDGIERWEETSIHSAHLTALQVLGEKAVEDQDVFLALGIARQLQQFEQTAQQGTTLFARATQIPSTCIARSITFDFDCPDDFPLPERESFLRAVNYFVSARWKKSLTILESLLPHVESWPKLWLDISILRYYLGHTVDATNALSQYAACPGIPVEDAVDAELLRLSLSKNPLGDQIDIYRWTCDIQDCDRVREVLLSDSRFRSIPFDPRQVAGGDSPPPMLIFAVQDKPEPTIEQLTRENASYSLCSAMLFGKQTDRDARIELVLLKSTDKDQVATLLTELIGPQILRWEEPHVLGSGSATELQLQRSASIKNPETDAESQALTEKLQSFMLEDLQDFYVNYPYGFLGGKTPTESVKEPVLKNRVLAGIELLESWLPYDLYRPFGDSLRKRLGLPAREMIPIPAEFKRGATGTDLADTDPSKEGHFVDMIPTWRWDRIDWSAIKTGELLFAFHLSFYLNDRRLITLISRPLLERPVAEVGFQFRQQAYQVLIQQAFTSMELEQVNKLLEQAREEQKTQTDSDSWLNLIEVNAALAQGDVVKFQDIATHLMTEHRSEPETMQTLFHMFRQLGLVNQDGSLAIRNPQQPGPSAMSPVSPIVSSETESAPTSKLWVPD